MGRITVFKSIESDSQSQYFEIDEVLERIRRGNNRHLIEQIRSEQNKAKRDTLKKRLFWICFSGEFSKRNNESMIRHSGFICLDFDGIPEKDLQMWKNRLKENCYTYACFISPSGNGLKVIWKVPECATNDEHNRRFDAIAEQFKDNRYFDRNVKGWSRVCFESYDPQIYIDRESSLVFEGIAEPVEISTPIQLAPAKNTDIQLTFDKLVKWFESKHNMRKGNRNQGAFTFATGVAEYLTLADAEPMLTNYIMSHVEQPDGDPFPRSECESCIRQAYRNNPVPRKLMNNDHVQNDEPNISTRFAITELDFDNDVLPDRSPIPAGQARAAGSLRQPEPDSEHTVFWSYTGRGAIKVDYLSFKLFLEANGFFKYRFNPEDISFIRIVNNIVSIVTVDQIRDFVLDWLMKRGEVAAYNLFAADSKFDKKYIAFLEIKKPAFIKDTKFESWIFYRNTAVKITKSGIDSVPYIDLSGYIWERQKIDRDFVIASADCDFTRFLMNISNNNADRCQALMTGIGYMLHRYKSPSTVRALIANDELISNDPAGGTGKGLIFQALGKIRVMVSINGKSLDTNKSFVWQRIDPDTDIVFIDETSKNFKFDSLFSILTSGWPIEKKNKAEICLSFEDSPKVGIATNNVLKGNGSSHKRRKAEYEVSPYYSAEYQPIDEFQRDFWNDWDEPEYNGFDNLMLNCIKLFLTSGIIEPIYVNLDVKKMIAETSEEFAGFARMHLTNNARYHRNEMFKQFETENPGSYCKSSNQFYDWMREWGKYNGWRTMDCGQGRMYIQYGDVNEEFNPDVEPPLPF